MTSTAALARPSRDASRARLRVSPPSAARTGIIARSRGRVKAVSRLVGSSAKSIPAFLRVATSCDLETLRNGRANTTPSRSDCRAIAASPAMPLPRNIRISSVSAWSSRVCAVRICVAPQARAACASSRYRAVRAAAGNPVFGLGAGPAHGAMGQIEAARQAFDGARLLRGFGAQAVIDRDGDEPRAARQRAAPARRKPHQRDRVRTAGDREDDAPARPSSPRTGVLHPMRRWRNCRRAWAPPADVESLSKPGHAPSPAGCADPARQTRALALHPLLLTVHGRFDAARGARIFPRHLAERGAGGFLFLQRRQRLSEPQQRVRRLRRFVEFGGHREKGFGGIAILLALEQAFAQPVLRIRRAADRSGYFCAKLRMVCSASA